MFAASFQTTGQPLEIVDVPMPVPGPGELLIKVKYCGVCGTDTHLTDAASIFNPCKGSVLGHEFCGEVVEVGVDAAGRWQAGQRIVALPFMGCGLCAPCLAGDPVFCAGVRSHVTGAVGGGFAQYMVVGAAESIALPDSVSWEEAAFVEPMAVALHTLDRALLKPGNRVLVLGAGPVGLAVTAAARALGAETVCVAARTAGKAERALRMGATAFFLNDEDLGANVSNAAGGPPDLIVECVGLPGMFQNCVQLAAPRTTIAMAGTCMQPEQFMPIIASSKELRVQFSTAYTLQDFRTAIDMIAGGTVKPLEMLSDTVDLADFPRAFEELRTNSSQCKVLLAPNA